MTQPTKPLPEPWRLTPDGEATVKARADQLREFIREKRAARAPAPKAPA